MPKYDVELMLEHRISMHSHFSDFQFTNSENCSKVIMSILQDVSRKAKQKKIDSNSNSVSFSEQTNGISANGVPTPDAAIMCSI